MEKATFHDIPADSHLFPNYSTSHCLEFYPYRSVLESRKMLYRMCTKTSISSIQEVQSSNRKSLVYFEKDPTLEFTEDSNPRYTLEATPLHLVSE